MPWLLSQFLNRNYSMRAFLMYIDDWLSSKHIRRMDGNEERGYLRLILHAASEPDGGLPTEEVELADISLLGGQWREPSQDPAKRFGEQTSGQKLLACLFLMKDGSPVNALTGQPEEIDERVDYSLLTEGRFYNTRLLREFQYQQMVSNKRKVSGEKGGRAKHKNREQERGPEDTSRQLLDESKQLLENSDQLPEKPLANGKQKPSNDVSVCVSGSVSDSSPVFSSEKSPRETASLANGKVLEIRRAAGPHFEQWWQSWSAVRGTNHKLQAAQAWISIGGDSRFDAIMACTASYLAANPAGTRGYNPENFLFDQSRDEFAARWTTRQQAKAARDDMSGAIEMLKRQREGLNGHRLRPSG
jgi:hypothetical protein